MVQVRKVQPKDVDELLQLADRLGIQSQIMAGKLENMMIVLEHDKVCGFGCFVNQNSDCILNWVFIQDAHRRNRLGTMLVKTMLNLAEQKGAHQAYLTCECSEFAEFLGFQKLKDMNHIKAINSVFQDIYKVEASNNIFQVSLSNYFKPCCDIGK